jgi:hypothetical protein
MRMISTSSSHYISLINIRFNRDNLLAFHIISLFITMLCIIYGTLLMVYGHPIIGGSIFGVSSLVLICTNVIVYLKKTRYTSDDLVDDNKGRIVINLDMEQLPELDLIETSNEYDVL